MIPKTLLEQFQLKASSYESATLRIVKTRAQKLRVRQSIVEAPHTTHDLGFMLTLFSQGGYGYSAQAGLDAAALERAFHEAGAWVEASRGSLINKLNPSLKPLTSGSYRSKVEEPWVDFPMPDRIELLKELEELLRSPEGSVESYASLEHQAVESCLIDKDGNQQHQIFDYVIPNLFTAVEYQGDVQKRSFVDGCSQGGVEELRKLRLRTLARELAEEAVALSRAENCPDMTGNLLLMPDQMMLQIHESIGHPLELDRILGDERNYAGTSFVELEMFGKFQYGSKHLNVSFDPNYQNEFASYDFDDDGRPAQKMLLIEEGILQAPLGGELSSHRADLSGASSTRACNWNRPPIDRMANLNIEPGADSFDELISKTEHGVLMKTNTSWSIDDSRNKFQFSCEYGQLIRNGKLAEVVKNPSYRGVSSKFWNNLVGVGNRDTAGHYGTPFCGKGEPNQAIRVGHASPACLFQDIEIFGGGQ